MKRSRFSEEQVAYALRQGESGTPVGDVCRQLGVSEATFYVWKKRYGHLGVNEVRQVRQLEEENSRLKAAGRGSRAGQAHVGRGAYMYGNAGRRVAVVLGGGRDETRVAFLAAK